MRLALAVVAMLALVSARPIDWAKSVTRATNGAYVIGNPKAKVRFVEYVSYSCPHCAHFTGASAPTLKAMAAKGTLAIELRNAVRDRYDFAAALLARCGGAGRFVGNHEALFAGQDALLAKATAFEASSTVTDSTPVNDALTAMARGAGLIDFMASRGFTAAHAEACLIDKPSQTAVLAMTKDAWETRKIGFTPYFMINGQPTGPGAWPEIEPKLRAALAAR